jgi:hypothetical protein
MDCRPQCTGSLWTLQWTRGNGGYECQQRHKLERYGRTLSVHLPPILDDPCLPLCSLGSVKTTSQVLGPGEHVTRDVACGYIWNKRSSLNPFLGNVRTESKPIHMFHWKFLKVTYHHFRNPKWPYCKMLLLDVVILLELSFFDGFQCVLLRGLVSTKRLTGARKQAAASV